MGTGVGRWEETLRRRAEWGTTRMGLGGSGWETKGLAVDQPWNIDEVDGAPSLVQDQPSGRQISLPPRVLAGSSSSSTRRRCEVAPKSSPRADGSVAFRCGCCQIATYLLSTASLTSGSEKRTRRPALWTRRRDEEISGEVDAAVGGFAVGGFTDQ